MLPSSDMYMLYSGEINIELGNIMILSFIVILNVMIIDIKEKFSIS